MSSNIPQLTSFYISNGINKQTNRNGSSSKTISKLTQLITHQFQHQQFNIQQLIEQYLVKIDQFWQFSNIGSKMYQKGQNHIASKQKLINENNKKIQKLMKQPKIKEESLEIVRKQLRDDIEKHIIANGSNTYSIKQLLENRLGLTDREEITKLNDIIIQIIGKQDQQNKIYLFLSILLDPIYSKQNISYQILADMFENSKTLVHQAILLYQELIFIQLANQQLQSNPKKLSQPIQSERIQTQSSLFSVKSFHFFTNKDSKRNIHINSKMNSEIQTNTSLMQTTINSTKRINETNKDFIIPKSPKNQSHFIGKLKIHLNQLKIIE